MMDTFRRGLMPLLWAYERSTSRVDPLATLPPRMGQVAALLLSGRKHRDIAKQLNLSVNTVRTTAHKLHLRFGVHSHAQFAALIDQLRRTR